MYVEIKSLGVMKPNGANVNLTITHSAIITSESNDPRLKKLS